MANNKILKRAERITLRYYTDDWHTFAISDLFSNIERGLRNLIDYAGKQSLTGKELIYVKEYADLIYKSVKEIQTNPAHVKYLKKYQNFLSSVIREKESLLGEIQHKNYPEKTIEIGIAKKLIPEIKELENKIDQDYQFVQKTIESRNSAAIQDAFMENDALLLVTHLKKAKDLNKTISSLQTDNQYADELDAIKKEAAELYDEISVVVIKDYDHLKELDATLQAEKPEFKNYYPIIKDDVDSELEELIDN